MRAIGVLQNSKIIRGVPTEGVAKPRGRVASLRLAVKPQLRCSRGCRLAPCTAVGGSTKSAAEQFVEELEANTSVLGDADVVFDDVATLKDDYGKASDQIVALTTDINNLYRCTFANLQVEVLNDGAATVETFDNLTEDLVGELGRTRPKVLQGLISAKEKADPEGWRSFQAKLHALKLQRARLEREAEDIDSALVAAERERTKVKGSGLAGKNNQGSAGNITVRFVLITGFESFNVDLYESAAERIAKEYPAIQLQVFSDRDITTRRDVVAKALEGADVFFGSLLFDFDQVEWLRKKIENIPVRFVFESALELMSCTQVGSFDMSTGGERKGPPPVVKKLLGMFGSQREEDRMVGYLSFLKVGPKLLQFIPGKKARDLKNWLTVYGYWNQGGVQNVVSLVLYVVENYLSPVGCTVKPVIETPATGCLHPSHEGYFNSPAEYMRWYQANGALRGTDAPVVGVLLYRKHVITEQPYIPQLILELEGQGIIPVPIFINGVEAHTIVRDSLTTDHEQKLLASGQVTSSTLKKDAVKVDAVVSTVGFPLVGGPAGSMEGGRQADVAKSILTSKNVPYVVAAPLLIQDMASWSRDGITGLQSVVLYSLPELDGAIDTVPLGGLVGNNIFLVGERVKRLATRLRKWVELRRKPPSERKVAVLLYGFPPGVGATGTAALLNVPKSLEALLNRLKEEGYNLGEVGTSVNGEVLVTSLKEFEDQRVIARGAAGLAKTSFPSTQYGFQAVAAEIGPQQLKEWLTYPPEWGPNEWGPIPFLPDNDILVRRLEKQWGDLRSYRGLMTTAQGKLLVPGLQAGNCWVGVQPLLGIEGDPMRLLFERDLTPHPQYAAFYKWLQHDFKADVVLHFGMHGTVEWLPGSPLGNTGFSWSDVLLADMPNVYVYACNNPSESIIAKRRGYGTIISHNVPPYGRAGLYKQLVTLKDLLNEYKEDPVSNDSLRGPIVDTLNLAGLQEDCPYLPDPLKPDSPKFLRPDNVSEVDAEAFLVYAGKVYQYLQVLENRLFSEGLHVLGAPPSPDQMSQFLGAYFGEKLPFSAVDIVANSTFTGSLDDTRARLESAWRASLDPAVVSEALDITCLLLRNSEELDGVVRALGGEYVLPEAGGDLLRDGAGVLPTGRNIHALDPYRMPSPAAMERGAAAAQAILDAHTAANGGALPETVAVNLWGLDAIKTKGESVAIALYMVGARPVKEGTGRVARFELIPLEELGRPRIDVLCNMSGIFRDSFQNVVELLDDLFQRAAVAEEPEHLNFVHKHAKALSSKGLTNTAARLFSNPAGDYGSMVNERIGKGSWESGSELGDTWASRNSFSYGRSERGTARPEVLQGLLETCDRVVQEIDSVEYGLTDIQEYYANTGALKRAAETARNGRAVGCSIVESFGKDVKPKELEDVLRLEYRSKLLNPRWAQAMADQGSGGAYEISQRMTAIVGWGATANFAEDWVWDQAAETYAFDPEMAEKLRKNNPQAFGNVLRRMLEAAGRGMWKAKPEMIQRLRELYADMDDELEGVR